MQNNNNNKYNNYQNNNSCQKLTNIRKIPKFLRNKKDINSKVRIFILINLQVIKK